MLWRHKWLIILLTALVTAGALYLSYRQTPLYRAEARLLVQALPSGAGTFAFVNAIPTGAFRSDRGLGQGRIGG